MQIKQLKAFTLMEILITIAIVGLLAAIAIPSYDAYAKKARYSELVQAAIPYKRGVDLCYQTTGSLINCRGGVNGVPPNLSTGSIASIAFIFTLSNGLIFVFPSDESGFNMVNDYYTLTPQINNGQLLWSYGGPGVRYI